MAERERPKVKTGDRMYLPVEVVEDRDRGNIVLEVAGRQVCPDARSIEEIAGRVNRHGQMVEAYPLPPEEKKAQEPKDPAEPSKA